jgi:Flp pilus assembly protein TadG
MRPLLPRRPTHQIRRLRMRDGASAIEFALLTPVIVVILMGIIEYGWLLYRRSEATRAVREGIRYAVVLPSTNSPSPASAAVTRCEEVLGDLNFDLTNATISTTTTDLTGDAAGTPDTLTLSLVMPYEPITGGLVPTPSGMAVSMSMMLQDSE